MSSNYPHDEKTKLIIKIDALFSNLYKFWYLFSLVLSNLFNDVIKVYKNNQEILMKILVKLFDYMLFYLYTFCTNFHWDVGIMHYIPESEEDKGMSNFIRRFAKIEKDTSDNFPGSFIRYTFRTDIHSFNEWNKFYLTPKDGYSPEYFSFYLDGLNPCEKYNVEHKITDNEWFFYCILQLIQSYIHSVLKGHVKISEYEYNLGLSKKNYEYLCLS